MSISFSGLASGLDTSSWVESLVALRQAKVDTLEEQKETVLLSRETLNNIKSFFNSFRSVIEKVTDAKYGVVSMDIFSQKLATSSNLNVLTATASTEAEEATYTVLVDNLATSTEALSGLNSFTTIVQTETATADTKLLDLGVKAGNIGITNNKGIYNVLRIDEQDTISSFISKLNDIEVDASYNQNTGIFGINLDNNSINDTLTVHKDGSVGTGIKDILHLQEKGGYESSSLQFTEQQVIATQATGSTKLSELGSISSGTIEVKSNGSSFTVGIDQNTTIDKFVQSLRNKGVDVEFSDGTIKINDAEIVDGGTGLLDTLGFEPEVNTQTQTSGTLKTVAVTTTVVAATGATKLSELGTITAGNLQVNINGVTQNISVSGNTTLSQFVYALNAKGVDAQLSTDGALTINDAELIDNGTGVIAALGLDGDVISKSQTSVDLKKVVVTTSFSAATSATKLSEIGSVNAGNVQVKANGTTYTVSVNGNTTISQFISSLTSKGIEAKFSSDGVLTITDAEIIDNGTGIVNALGLESEINSKTQIASGLKFAEVTTITSLAGNDTKLKELDGFNASSNTLTAKNAAGTVTNITVNGDTTLAELISKLNAAGLSAAMNNGTISITGGEVSGALATSLGIVSGGQNVTNIFADGNVLYSNTNSRAAGFNTFKELGISTAKPAGGYACAVYDKNNQLVKEITVSDTQTLDEFFAELKANGVNASISDGVITIGSVNGNFVKGSVAESLGITTSMDVNFTGTMSTSITITTPISATSTFASAGIKAEGLNITIYNNQTEAVVTSLTLDRNYKTFQNLFDYFSLYGISASLDDGYIVLDSADYYVGGSMADALGITHYKPSYTAGKNVYISKGNVVYTTITSVATENTKLFDVLNSIDGVNISYFSLGALSGYESSNITIGNYLSELKKYGIIGTISNGVITYDYSSFDQTKSFPTLSAHGTSGYKTIQYEEKIKPILGLDFTPKTVTSTRILDIVGKNGLITKDNSITMNMTLEYILGYSGDITYVSECHSYHPNLNMGYQYQSHYITYTISTTMTLQEFADCLSENYADIYSIELTNDSKNIRLDGFNVIADGSDSYTYNITGTLPNMLDERCGNIYSSYSNMIQTNISYANYDPNSLNKKLIDNGFSDGDTLTIITENSVSSNINRCTFKVEATTTFQDFIDWVNNDVDGITAMSTLQGALKLTGTNNGNGIDATYITFVDDKFASIFGFECGLNKSYTQNQVTALIPKYNKSQQLGTYSNEHIAVSASTLLYKLGLNSNGYLTIQSKDMEVSVLTVTSSMTLSDLSNALKKYGMYIQFGDENYISASNSYWITGASSNLLSALTKNLSSNSVFGNGKSYETKLSSKFINSTSDRQVISSSDITEGGDGSYRTIYTNKTNGTLTVSGTAFATLTSSLGGLKNSSGNGITFDANGLAALSLQIKTKDGVLKNATINFSKTQTLNDVIQSLNSYGIDAAVDGSGKISLNSNTLSDFNISGTLGNFLMGNVNKQFDASSGELIKTESKTTTVAATRSTKLSDLGVTAGEYNIYKNCVKYTALISSDETLGSFMDTLAAFGIQAGLVNEGTASNLVLQGSGDSYITKSGSVSNTSNVVEKLFGTAVPVTSYSYSGAKEVVRVMTATVAATGDTALSTFGVTSGEYYIFENGVKHTEYISVDDTIDSFISKLQAHGINATLVNLGGSAKLMLNSSGDSYVAKSNSASNSSNIVDKLFGTASTVNSMSYKGLEHTTKVTTATIAATADTSLSYLGITSGEYYIYKDGVKYTALISSDETLGSLIDTLKSFGFQAGLLSDGSGTKLAVIGSGDSYIAKSNNSSNASNIADTLFSGGSTGSSKPVTSYTYSGNQMIYSTVTHTSTATEDTLLSAFDTPWGGTTLKSAGDLVLSVDGKNRLVKISETETFGSLIDKLNSVGVEAQLIGGKFYISEMNNVSIVTSGTTSSIINPNSNIHLNYKSSMDMFMESTAPIEKTTTIIEEATLSASNYADLNTKLSTLNITSGTFSIYRNGQKATINIDSESTFSDLRSQISSRFSDIDLKFDNGKLVIYSKTDGVEVKAGSTTDSSNMLSITGLSMNENGKAVSARQLFSVNENSLLTQTGLFRKGEIKTGNFYVGEQVINITDKSTLNDIITQINSSDKSNATAYWDSINGKFVIKSRTTGSALINIEAGSSNFTDIMGYTETEWYADGSVKLCRMLTETQKMGDNARFSINGTSFTAASNTLTSDITRIKGLTMNLTGLTNGSAVTVKVEKDKETVANSLSEIVDSYNELIKNVDEAVARSGALHNQTMLKMLRNQIRNAMMSSIGGDSVFKNLNSIGISVASASANNLSTSNESIVNLSFDKDKFMKAYNADADAVKELLIGKGIKGSIGATDGVFTKVEAIVENSLTSVIGYFSIADEAYGREIKKLDNKIVKGNEAIEKYRARLNKKFNSMDMLISNMQNQYSSFLGN